MKKAIFLDRDGVINKKAACGDYIKSWDEFFFLPRAVEAIALLSKTDYMLIVVTNQRGIARGIMSEESLERIHASMTAELREAGARIDSIFYCPHEIEERCGCRKPQPGMLLKARDLLGVNLQESCLIGDSASDIEAGFKAGCKELSLIAVNGSQEVDLPGAVYRPVKSLYEAALNICNKRS